MMVESILESSQDFGMSNGALPQWKRELLQRRQARGRAPGGGGPAPPPPPPLPPPPEDEELRYGPGIVKRLKSRYLSLALRDAPRRRASVLRRAASLEHLLDERPPPAPRAPRAPRPASLAPSAALAPSPRRDFVKRARSVDALSRLDAPPEPEPRPPRAPRRPQPLLREAERPPPDVVRAALRKFESAPPRRAAPAARVSAVLRGLEPRRSPTPEPAEPPPPAPAPSPAPLVLVATSPTPPPSPEREPAAPPPPPPPRSPSPIAILAISSPPLPSPPTVPAPKPSPPPSAAPTPEPMESPTVVTLKLDALVAITVEKSETRQIPDVSSYPIASPRAEVSASGTCDEMDAAAAAAARMTQRAALEQLARGGQTSRYAFSAPRTEAPLCAANPVLLARRVGVIRPMPAAPASPERPPPPPRVNGHSTPEPGALSRIGAAGIERAWSGSNVKRIEPSAPAPEERPPWLRAAARPRAPPPAATSVVFNFSNRKEVPDYIENDGIILRANRRNRIKAGETGVVVLRAEALAAGEEEEEEWEAGPPSPCDVRFVNDNVLINGKSSMPARPDPDRVKKLKLQFDDSLTRTFEYPSETSLSEEPPATPAPPQPPPPPDTPAPLADNTHIASAALCRYTPSKTCAAAFQLGLTNPHAAGGGGVGGVGGGALNGAAAPEEEAAPPPRCASPPEPPAPAPSWSDARAHHTDLLF